MVAARYCTDKSVLPTCTLVQSQIRCRERPEMSSQTWNFLVVRQQCETAAANTQHLISSLYAPIVNQVAEGCGVGGG